MLTAKLLFLRIFVPEIIAKYKSTKKMTMCILEFVSVIILYELYKLYNFTNLLK